MNAPEEDRWERTSFDDATEAAIHYAMVHFLVETQERESGADLSDIYIWYRRVIRDLATGKADPQAFLDSLE